MRNLVTVLVCIIGLTTSLSGQAPSGIHEPKVDERVELMSIVFRLAECQEYMSTRYSDYTTAIETHFAPYRNHEVIRYVKKVLRPRGIGYDAVMFMAISITPPPNMRPIQPFSSDFPESRWGKRKATRFLSLLNDFYAEARCEEFFTANKERYKHASLRFDSVYNALDVSWYTSFYNEKPTSEFKIINALGNGGGNYGPSLVLDSSEVLYAIMGTWSVDEEGQPMYATNEYLPTLIHEFNHSFINHLVEQYEKDLSKSGEIIFSHVEEKMRKQAYGTWQVMMAEALVRASVIKYLIDHSYASDFIDSEMADEVEKGFVWTPDLVNLLMQYDANRSTYPTFEPFMPEVVAFFEVVKDSIDARVNKVETQD